MNLADLRLETIGKLSDEELRAFAAETVTLTSEDRKQNQILFYQPASPKVQVVHDSKKKIIGIGGGNRSSKTETALVELVMCATGVFPYSQRHLVKQKFRGPIQCRLVVESLTTTLEPIILPKLQWWHWDGVDEPGGERGHWGWIPKNCLIDGQWSKSWNARLRMLRLVCWDPENPGKALGESTIHCMSIDQDASDFASGAFHLIVHDEPPRLAQWRENETRIMSVDGRILLAMTWPDDPSINVDWLYNEVYEPARAGHADIDWFELWSTENRNLRQEAVAAQAGKWSQEIVNVRIYGRPIRFSNRIHPEFTDHAKTWCMRCQKSIIAVPALDAPDKHACPECASSEIVDFCHVEEFDIAQAWPTVFVLDPHPRKPHMFLWVQISPQDDWYVVADGKCAEDCVEVRKQVERTEQDFGLWIAQRIMDPNMGASPSGQRREVTWQDEFATAGLRCDLADDIDIGRARINTMLKPDAQTLRPRLLIHPRCRDTIYQLNRYSWSDFSKRVERDLKEQPKDMYSDFPSCLKYVANSEPVFRFLKSCAPILTRLGHRQGAY